MADTSYTIKPTCPHCGHVDHDDWEINFGPGLDGDTVTCCDACGLDYFLSRLVIVRYRSEVVKT